MPYNPLSKNFDIREYKTKLRAKYRNLRTKLSPNDRKLKDDDIFKNIISLREYTRASVVLCFVSMEEEIDTHRFIEKCIARGKRVGVPYCIDNSREMDFYFITSISDLKPRTFGVLEPDPEIHTKVTDFSDAICILPGLSFDNYGYRIGYGGGYYDRFLSGKFDGIAKIGICYRNCIRHRIIRGRYDVACDYIVTEKSAKPRKIPNNPFNKERIKNN